MAKIPTEQVAVRYPVDDVTWARAFAATEDMTLAQLLRRALRMFRSAAEEAAGDR